MKKVFILAFAALAFAACNNNKAAEQANDAIQEQDVVEVTAAPVENEVKEGVENASDEIKSVVDNATEAGKEAIENVKDAAKEVVENAKEAGKQAVDAAKGAANDAIKKAEEKVKK